MTKKNSPGSFLKKASIAVVAQALPLLAFAQGGTGTGTGTGIAVEPKTPEIETVLTNVMNYFLGFVVVACIFMLIYAGFSFVTAAGDEKKVENARKTITYAVVGLIVALLAKSLVGLVRGIIGA